MRTFIKKHILRLITVVFKAKSEASQNYPGDRFHNSGYFFDYIGTCREQLPI